MGITCAPTADSCEYMAKPPQYCKVISFQLKFFLKIEEIKKKKNIKKNLCDGIFKQP